MKTIKLKLASVRNMMSNRGNLIANQFVITTPKGEIFQSYQTVIAYRCYKDNIMYIDPDYAYSVTTGKYRNIFLRETRAETERKIEAGIYKMANLNE